MVRTLLLADDNEDDVFFFRVAMKRLGLAHHLRVARDGREAIAIMREYAAQPLDAPRLSLALLDLKMPGLGGFEVLTWKNSVPGLARLPVIVVSSSEQERDVAEAYRLGAAAYLVKPSQPDQLTDLIRLLDRHWLGENPQPVPAASPFAREAMVPVATAS
jgi:CheY-like chemotaxis protein